MTIEIETLKKYNFNNVLIETGTAAGDGVQRAIDAGFKQIYSCEAIDLFWNRAYDRFVNQNNVCIYFDQSDYFLEWFLLIAKQLIFSGIERMPSKKNLTFVLDAHFTRCARTPVPEKNISPCPVLEEIRIIGEHMKQTNLQHIILIDDRRLFKGAGHKDLKVTEGQIMKALDEAGTYKLSYEDSKEAIDDVIVADFRKE